MTSCTSAADKYQSGEIQLEIKQEKAKLKTEIEAYNQYFDIYENFKKDMVLFRQKGIFEGIKMFTISLKNLRRPLKK